MNFKHKLLVGIATLSIFAMSGCLKSRTQLRDESEPVSSEPREVSHAGGGGGGYAIDEIKSELTRLTGKIEDLERANAGGAAAEEHQKKLERRIEELETAQASMIEALKKMEGNIPPPDTSDVYEKGRKQFKMGNFEAAIEHLSVYLKTPKAKFEEDATFLRGEAYYELKEYSKAILDFSKFADKFTKSLYTPKAFYKIGLSFDALGQSSDAKTFYDTLVREFPKSSEAQTVLKRRKGKKG